MNADVRVIHGDCLDILRTLPDASVDAVVTDPPYGLEFMGKEWDAPWKQGADVHAKARDLRADEMGDENKRRYIASAVNKFSAGLPFQQWCELWATECLRVLKPGGHMLAFGGTRTWHRLACAVEDAGFEIRDSIAWLYGSGFPKSLNLPGGLGTALKPAHEPIVVARKPLVGTVATNVLTHGTGALNVDACRIETTDRLLNHPGTDGHAFGLGGGYAGQGRRYAPDGQGRWPANVVLDETQADTLDQMSGELTSGANPTRRGSDGDRTAYGDFAGQDDANPQRGVDSGGASRFFYVAKADTTERVRLNGTAHPTVKPLALMRWLVRLVTPPGGTVLEPFAGSGTTVEACILEGFSCIAIEREPEYLPLIQQRIDRLRDPVAAIRATGDDPGLFDPALW